MKAIVYEKYGPPEVLHLVEIEIPIPQDNEALVKVHAAGVTLFDCWMRSSTAPPGFGILSRLASGIRKPKQMILGTDFAGEIKDVGKGVTRLKVGDQVYGFSGFALGTHAEYLCLPEEAMTLKPVNGNYEEAAAVVQGGLTALFFLRKANIQPGQQVLIFGASGGVGGYAVQLAKHYFKANVTGVCSGSKTAYVKSLGADQVIDYTQEDFTKNGQVYDVVFDTVGKTSVSRTRKSLRQNGWYLLATFGLPMLVQLLWFSKSSGLNFEFGTLTDVKSDLIILRELLEKQVIKPVIDQCYPLEQATEAHRYVEAGHKMGNVVITM